MANMTFKASLLPSTDLGYSLGSNTQRWKINGIDISMGTQYKLLKYGNNAIENSNIVDIGTVQYHTITPGYTSGGEQFYKACLAYLASTFPNGLLHTGVLRPNSQGPVIGNIYNVNEVNSDGLPQYSTFIFHNLNNHLESFGTSNYTYYHRTYLDDINYTSYTVQKDGTGASGTWGISITGNATTANSVKDYNNNTLTKFGYSTAGMGSTSWLGSWDATTSGEYRLRAITPANAIKSGIGTTAIGKVSLPIYWDGSVFKTITSYEGVSAFVGKGTHTAAITANEFTPLVGSITVLGNVSNTTMSHSNNANAEMIIKTHPTSGSSYYEARLGFSSNGKLYYMPVNTTSWKQIAYTDSNAASASKWATARTLTIGETGKEVDGTANVSWGKAEILGESDTTKFYRGDQSWSNEISGGIFKVTNNENTVSIGSQDESYAHFMNSADIPFYFNKAIHLNGDLIPYGNSNSKKLGSSSKRWQKLYIGTADSYGTTTQPIYWKAGVPTAITYTANRLYYPSAVNAFTAGTHYVSDTKIAINSTSVPNETLYVNGITKVADGTDATSNSAAALVVTGGLAVGKKANIGTLDGGQHIINGNVQLNAQSGSYNEGLRINRSTTGYANIYLGGTRSSASGAQTGGWWIGTISTPNDATSTGDSITNTVFTISNNSTADTLSIKGTRGATIGTNSGWAIRPRLAVGTTYQTGYNFYVNGTSYLSSDVHIASTTDVGLNQAGALVIGTKTGENIGIDTNEIMARNNGAASTLYLNNEGGKVQVGATLQPNATNSKTLGTSSLRWSKLYVGTADSYGAADRPIYWNAGVPTATTYRMSGTNITATTARAITENLETGNWYVNGTNSTDLYSQSDGVAYVVKHSDNWIHEIYGDYRTGQIAVRGKIKGTWQAWRKVLDTGNYASLIDSRYVNVTGDTMTGALTMNKTGQQLVVPYNGTNYDVLHNHGNGDYSLSACGGGLYIGYYTTSLMNWLNGQMTLQSGNLTNSGSTSQGGPEYQLCTSVTRGTATSVDNFFRTAPEWTDSAGKRLAQIEYHKSKTNSELLIYVLGDHTSSDQYNGLIISKALGNTNGGNVTIDANAGKLYGAVWNDYAEYRETKEEIEPGRCIKETGNGDLILTTQRLERGCEVVSDTYGFAIGQSKKCNTPTAASGRVLTYLYEDNEYAKNYIGWPVCSGPNGTVSIMTEEEEMKYPSRIIGTISEIPNYDIWYAGGEEVDGSTPIKVNGRIWIRIR